MRERRQGAVATIKRSICRFSLNLQTQGLANQSHLQFQWERL